MRSRSRETAIELQDTYDEEIAEAASHVGTGTIFILSALIGAWGLTCLVSAAIQFGIFGTMQGWLNAITGG